MAGNNEYLNVFVGSKLAKDFKKPLNKAVGIYKGFGSKISGTFSRITSGINAQFVGLAAGIGAAGVGAAVKSALSDVADTGRLAADIGTGTAEFSRLAYAATASGAEVEDLSEAMKEYNLRISEAAALGTGGLAEAFDLLGLSAKEFKELDPSEAFKRIVGELEGYGAADRGFLADAIFGGDSNYILGLIDRGRAGIEELTAEADRLGITMSADRTQGAKAANAAFGRLSATIGGTWKGLVADLAPAIESVADVVGAAAGRVSAWMAENRDEINAVVGTMAYVTEHWRDAWGVAVDYAALKFGEVWDYLSDLFGSRIPGVVTAAADFVTKPFQNAVTNIKGLFGELYDYIASGGTDPIDFRVVGVADGMREALAELKEASQRTEGDMVSALREELDESYAVLRSGIQGSLQERERARREAAAADGLRGGGGLSLGGPEEKSAGGGGSGKLGAVTKGSVEAISAVIQARSAKRSPHETAVEKHTKATADELRKIAREFGRGRVRFATLDG